MIAREMEAGDFIGIYRYRVSGLGLTCWLLAGSEGFEQKWKLL